jgi:hypothetical protein
MPIPCFLVVNKQKRIVAEYQQLSVLPEVYTQQ